MGIQPNLVVGALGTVVFLVTGSIIVSNWKDLTGREDWQAVVVPFENRPGGQARTGHMDAGASKTFILQVAKANITAFHLTATWTDTSPTTAYDVTLALTPTGGFATKSTTQRQARGSTGVDLSGELLERPSDSRFTSTGGDAQSQFEARYPAHNETRGSWRATLTLNRPTPIAGSGINDVLLDLDIDYYLVELREPEQAELVK